MNPTLRPMSLGEILDRSFHMYRQRFWVFFAIAALPAIAMLALQFVNMFWWRLEPPHLIPILGVNFGITLYLAGEYHCSLFFHAFAWPCIAVAASRAYLGQQPGLRASLVECRLRWKSWIGLSLLLQFMVVLLAELAGAAVYLGVTALADWLSHDNAGGFMDDFMPPWTGVMILAGFAFSLWLGTLFMESIPAWCAEQTTIRKSFQRSRLLSKNSRWRLLCLRLTPVTMVIVLDLAASATIRWAVFAIAAALHHPAFVFGAWYGSAYVLVSSAVAALVGPLFPIALTLLYYDQRIRKEGFDIECMMTAAGMRGDPDAVPVAVESGAAGVASVPVESVGA